MLPRLPRPHVRGGALALLLVGCAALPGCEPQATEITAVAEAPIVGGTLDTLHSGVVSLLRQAEGGFYPTCSATLLTQNLVLTARHCVAPLSSGDASSVECGETKFQSSYAPSTLRVSVGQDVWETDHAPYRVREVWVPPGGNQVCGRDIALLLLSGSGVPASVATPIAPRLDTGLRENDRFLAIGYGLQDPEDRTGETGGKRMSSTEAQVFCEGAACGSLLVDDSEFIAESPVCSGDSGGPAIDADGLVSGVTSRGDVSCTLGIYGSVASWKSFIIEKAFVAAQSGSYVAPLWAGAPPPGYVPAVDPLGLSCSGACSTGYQCWSASGTPPGICVPPCGTGYAECPSRYSCDTQLSVCTPEPSPKSNSSGCTVAAPHGRATSAWVGLGLVALGYCRSRKARGRARSK